MEMDISTFLCTSSVQLLEIVTGYRFLGGARADNVGHLSGRQFASSTCFPSLCNIGTPTTEKSGMALPSFLSFLFFTILCICRAYSIIPSAKPQRVPSTRPVDSQCHLAVFLGSGGHTSEALLLLSALDFKRYIPRTYIVSRGDALSVQRALAFESSKKTISSEGAHTAFRILSIPRARHVYQSLFMTPPTAVLSLMTCIYHLCLRPLLTRRSFADVLLVNGPGTCVILCAAVYISRFFFIPSPRLIYVESFARVGTLSLSGRLLRPFVDKFVVQWPEALKDGRRGDYRGWLV